MIVGNRFTINDICTKFMVSPPWIHKLEAMGLLNTPEGEIRVRGKRRYYTDQNLRVLNFIFTARRIGLELEEIKRLKNKEKQLFHFITSSGTIVEAKSLEEKQLTTKEMDFIFFLAVTVRLDNLRGEEKENFLRLLEEHRAAFKQMDVYVKRLIELEKETAISLNNIEKSDDSLISELKERG